LPAWSSLDRKRFARLGQQTRDLAEQALVLLFDEPIALAGLRAMTTDAATSLPLYQRLADELSTLIRRGQLGLSFAPGRLFSASDRAAS
jgi:hypothetical protein